MTIRNPIEWGADSARLAANFSRAALATPRAEGVRPEVRVVPVSVLKDVLAKGFDDFVANRTDVVFLCLLYPLAGFVIAELTVGRHLLPLLFPLVSGFALVGPFAATGLYEMSRRRERGLAVSWRDAFGVFASPSIAPIFKLSLLMSFLFVAWLAAAWALYRVSFGSLMPTTPATFVMDVLTTLRGWTLVIVGGAVGFIFALVALTISVVSFPLLLDRDVSIASAVGTSVRAVKMNPIPMLAWGAIVAASLVIGSLPALAGLIVVMPVLGHATWHLYRAVVV